MNTVIKFYSLVKPILVLTAMVLIAIITILSIWIFFEYRIEELKIDLFHNSPILSIEEE
jgi:uncharacterized membrane protein YdbT with pleckstrin-like domain